jgi:hypothetical protein
MSEGGRRWRVDSTARRNPILRSGSMVEIRWPVYGSEGCSLEGARSFTATDWAALNAAPPSGGPNWKVTLGASGASQYFRLRR